MPILTIAGETVKLPRMNAPIPEAIIKLPVGFPWANGGQVNLRCEKARKVYSVHWSSHVKVPAVHELLIVLACYNPDTGAMPFELGRALHEPGGDRDNPTPSTVTWTHHYGADSVVIPKRHVVGIWAVGGMQPNSERFSGNPLELWAEIEMDSTDGVTQDWPPKQAPKSATALASAAKAMSVPPVLPDWMRAWAEGRAKA